jgi:glycosyltransferase involved in cell wall biosynthesis
VPHLVYLAWGFPPAAKSCAYRLLAMANSFARHGWRVTVVTLTEDAWLREHGLDTSLLALVDPRVKVVRLPLYRADLDTDIRTYSRFRAQRPMEWRRLRRSRDQIAFPEAVFGPWRSRLESVAEDIHARDPIDLVLATAAPYTFFAPALYLHRHHGVPYVLDYRDAWGLDIINDREAFAVGSRRGRLERRLLEGCTEAWFVNAPIKDWYAFRHLDLSNRFQIVRNGSDVALGTSRIPVQPPDPRDGVRFGYLGTVSFVPQRTLDLCEAWREARRHDALVARSRLDFRGHIGAGAARGANGHSRVLHRFAGDNVTWGGPVPKAETAAVYAGWDALVLCLVGGRYVTSGKVYDYVSTGLPIMSAHEPEHAAAEVLADYPLWVRNAGLTVPQLADAFIETAHLAVDSTDVDRKQAQIHAERFERYAQIEPAVARLTNRFMDRS